MENQKNSLTVEVAQRRKYLFFTTTSGLVLGIIFVILIRLGVFSSSYAFGITLIPIIIAFIMGRLKIFKPIEFLLIGFGALVFQLVLIINHLLVR